MKITVLSTQVIITMLKTGLYYLNSNIVKNHISKFEVFQPNTDMINRLEKAMKNGEKIKSADASFYMHELSESHLMNKLTKTMDFSSAYDVAHNAALNKYEVSPFSVYHPEVIAKVKHI